MESHYQIHLKKLNKSQDIDIILKIQKLPVGVIAQDVEKVFKNLYMEKKVQKNYNIVG